MNIWMTGKNSMKFYYLKKKNFRPVDGIRLIENSYQFNKDFKKKLK